MSKLEDQQEREYDERVRLGKLMRDAKADPRAMIMYRHTMGSRVFDFARRSEAPLMFVQALKALEDAGYRIEKPPASACDGSECDPSRCK